MKILVISQYFYPENFRINDLVFSLKKRGHNIEVLTGKPNYPLGRIFKGYNKYSLDKEKFLKFKNVSIYPGVRNKPDWFYKGSLRFLKCSLIPFREKRWFLPRFFTGRATSVFGICTK